MLDVGITQGSYWKGTQIPYWLYLTLVILPTGFFGLDHLLLRSPLTGILKALLNFPMFGFWYFYDIAQATGERKLIEKYGLGVPYYGPIGIGAGIFKGTEGLKESPPKIPRPWRFIFYILTSLIFIVFPVNKLVLGDYPSAIFQLLMYFIFPLTIISILWGFYDTFKILFDTRFVLEKGVARIFPARWLIDDFFDRTPLGPGARLPPEPNNSWLKRFFAALIEAPITTIKAYTSGVRVVRDATIGVAEVAQASTIGVAKAVTSATIGTINTAGEAAKGVVNDAKSTAGEVVQHSLGAVDSAVQASSGAIKEGQGAIKGFAKLATKVPNIIDKVSNKLSDPSAIAGAATVMKGGFQGSDISISSSVLLFSVALLAFGGYVLYSLRNHFDTEVEEENDSPPDARAVRRAPKIPEG